MVNFSASPAATPRVRHQAREVCALMAFSAAVSIGLALSLVLLISIGGQG